MFEDIDIEKCVEDSAIITSYLILTLLILLLLSGWGIIPADFTQMVDVKTTILGIAIMFNLVFGMTVAQQM